MGNTRFPRPSQTSGDSTVSNGVVENIGILGLPIEATGFPILGGLLYVDEQQGLNWKITQFGGDLSGSVGTATVVQINQGSPINASQVAARIHARM